LSTVITLAKLVIVVGTSEKLIGKAEISSVVFVVTVFMQILMPPGTSLV
jgi:hypothetical protein